MKKSRKRMPVVILVLLLMLVMMAPAFGDDQVPTETDTVQVENVKDQPMETGTVDAENVKEQPMETDPVETENMTDLEDREMFPLEPVLKDVSQGNGPVCVDCTPKGNLPELKPETQKSLEPNDDGTYWINLEIMGPLKENIPKPKIDVVFVIDVSSSMRKHHMYGSDGKKKTRLEVLKEEVNGYENHPGLIDHFLGNPDVDAQLAIVSYAGGGDWDHSNINTSDPPYND